MSEPIIELIAENIEAAINQITVAAGFSKTLTAYRPKMVNFSDVTPKDGLVIIFQDDEEPAENPGTETTEWNQTFNLVAMVIPSDKSTDPIDIMNNRVRADIQKKLLEDDTRGKMAITTILGPSAIYDAGEGFAGISVKIIVNYRHGYDNPRDGV